ncbi:MAG TPA: CvpA family protein [Advenella sp.]|nr:CvpA family protein [Advenella sp.]
MQSFLWVDWVILAIILISCVISLVRGFVREALSLATWIAAFIIARLFHPNMQALLVDTISVPSVRFIAAFLILFVATLIVGALINHLIGALVRMTGLTGTDRVLGVAFGLARGVVVVVASIALLRMTPVTQDDWWNESTLIAKFALVENWSRTVFGDSMAALF